MTVVVSLVASILPLVALFQVFDGLSAVTAGILRAVGKQFTGALLNLSAYYVIGASLASSFLLLALHPPRHLSELMRVPLAICRYPVRDLAGVLARYGPARSLDRSHHLTRLLRCRRCVDLHEQRLGARGGEGPHPARSGPQGCGSKPSVDDRSTLDCHTRKPRKKTRTTFLDIICDLTICGARNERTLF